MKSKEFFGFLWEVSRIVIIALAIVIPIRFFLFQPFIVQGSSMEPNFHSGDYLIIDEISYEFQDPQRGDIIVFEYPLNPSNRYIKRIIGLPGETITAEDGNVYITKDGNTTLLSEDYLPKTWKESWENYNSFEQIELGEGEYFVMGDNRNASSDSRKWGILPEENIIGKVFFNFSPDSLLVQIKSSSN